MIRVRAVAWACVLGVLVGVVLGGARAANAQELVEVEASVLTGSDDGQSSAATSYDSIDGFSVLVGKGWMAADDPVVTGLRFADLDVPAGATIATATLTLRGAYGDGAFTVRARINAEAADDAVTFGAGSLPHERLPGVTASDLWEIALDEWADNDHTSPDFAEVVQEVIDRPGWADGNALVLMLTDDGGDDWIGGNAVSYETDPLTAARLTLTYVVGGEAGGCGTPCVVTLDDDTAQFVIVLGALLVFLTSVSVVAGFRRG